MNESASTNRNETIELVFDRSCFYALRIMAAWYLILFGAVALFIRPSSDLVVLRYNAFFGVDILGTWWQVYFIPGISFIFFIGHFLLAVLLRRRGFVLPALLFLFGSLILALATAVAVAALIFINS